MQARARDDAGETMAVEREPLQRNQERPVVQPTAIERSKCGFDRHAQRTRVFLLVRGACVRRHTGGIDQAEIDDRSLRR